MIDKLNKWVELRESKLMVHQGSLVTSAKESNSVRSQDISGV